ncbi:MAG: NADP oxidoreductase [Tepidisphaeraceae bacterium]|jgi:NAD-reducing hydrogenase small subunit
MSAQEPAAAVKKVRIATVWLDGCSGCHMSFLDMDQRLLELAPLIELVYSPLVDHKEFPPDVDVTLVEGSVSTDEDLRKIRMIRGRTKILVSLGDCAVTGNVPAMRNPFGAAATLDRAYNENAQLQKQTPTLHLPTLLERVRPVHEVVEVDVFVPGCPPPADAIFYVVGELLAGRTPDVGAVTRFGR